MNVNRNVDNIRGLVLVFTQVFAVLCLVLSAVVILTMVTGAHVLIKTKREYRDNEVERAGRRQALSTRFNNEDREWLQEDVEVLPGFNLKKPQVPRNKNAHRGGEVEMRNIPVRFEYLR